MTISPAFEIAAPVLGGGLIGLAAAMLLLFSGRIAGISGILGGFFTAKRNDMGWRAFFLAGLLIGGVVMLALQPERFTFTLDRSLVSMALAGVIVGFGTRLGNGCTSGHGVCGVSRLSKRSIVATATFMGAGAITVFIINHVLGGAL